MGQELDCTMHYKRRAIAGRAMLETDYLLFRGDERLKLMFRDLTGVTAVDGVLKLQFAGGPAAFDLGNAAAKWAEKILHPPSRLDKLGIKEGSAVRLVGAFDESFLNELRDRKAKLGDAAAITCFAAVTAADLKRVPTLAKAMKPKDALWIVYPKGVPVIREIDVIEAGRAATLKDVKVASFSSSHTGLKFVK